MAFIDRSSRVGRSQGASIFWGLVSVFFAAAACFYYWKNHENETTADVMRDQVLQLREENETLNSQKDHLQASKTEAEAQLKTREDLVAEKETQLAAEEAHLDGLNQQVQSQSQQTPSQAAIVRKFNEAIRKLNQNGTADVVERGGRPVLRLPNAGLFAPGDATLKPEGKALLNQLTTAIAGQIDNFELRVVSYTDTEVEAESPDATKKDTDAKPAADASAKPHYATSWDLTAARAATLGHYYRDQSTLPFLNVLVIGRADSEPISSNTGPNHARNCRVEITVTPMPASFHAPDADKDKDKASANPATPKAVAKDTPKPAADTSAPAKKDKAKDSAKTPDVTPAPKKSDKGSGH